MCSTVCHGLQACLEPRFADQQFLLVSTESRFLRRTESSRLKKPTSDPTPFHPDPKKTIKPVVHGSDFHSENNPPSEPESVTWNSIQSVTTGSKESNSYIHPLAKRSSPTLSKKSLELCTESLGCESGTNISDKDPFTSFSRDSSSDKAREEVKVRRVGGQRTGDIKSFPPPLTSISGKDSVHVRSHRQDGRLVLTAATFPSTRPYFQAERSDGRLKLSFLTQSSQSSTNFPATEQEIEVAETTVGDLEKMDVGNMNNNQNNQSETRVGQFEILSRCKEGSHGHGMIWEPSCCITI